MRQGFRPSLEPPKHRKAVVEARRPYLCLVLTAVVISLVFAIFGVSAWNVYNNRFGRNTLYFHAMDEISLRQVSDDLSAAFCDGYWISMWDRGHVYLLPSQAAVNSTAVDIVPVDIHQQPFRLLNVMGAYLLTGSSIDVTACRERDASGPFARIVLIKGDSNLKKWLKNSGCRDCILTDVPISFTELCDSGHDRNHAKLDYKVYKNDNYFLVVDFGRPQIGHHVQGPGISLRGVMKRTHFITSNAEEICYDKHCHFDLPWMSDKDVVVRFGGGPWVSPRNVTTHCQVRVVFGISLFGILPVVCVIPVAFLIGWFLCRRTRRNAKALRDKHEKSTTRQQRISEGKERRPGNVVTQNEDYGSVAIQEG